MLQSRYLLFLLLFASACSYTLPIKDGKTAYERKRFDSAIPLLKKEFNAAKTRSEKGVLAFQLAESYRRTGRDEEALPWFKSAAENVFGPDALRGEAYSLKKLERYDAAQEAFKTLGIEIGSPYEYRKEINGCKIAAEWLRDQPNTGITVEPAPFNSPFNDFSPVWASDGRIVFTSDRANASGKDNYLWTGNRFMDLYVVGAGEASAQSFDVALNTETNEGTLCFNRKGDEVYFVRAEGAYEGDDQYCRIFVSKREFDAWLTPEPLRFQKDKLNYLHPCLSPDGNTLYFASNDAEGWGGYDLYTVTKQPNSETGWSDPKLLSRSINTTGNELFPSFDADTLYFASDGLLGMGGLDIFRTYKIEKNAWSPPVNLKSPINSGADDFALIVDAASVNKQPASNRKTGDLLRTGFFTSNRTTKDSKGGDDIFRFEQRVPVPKPPQKDTVATKDIVYKMILEGYVVEKIFVEADNPNSRVLGRRPLDGAAVAIDAAGKKQTVVVGADGYFKIELAENADYSFVGSKSGYLSNSTKFSTRGIAKDPKNPTQTFEVEIVLDKIYRDKEIVLENIYYDYEKYDIRPDAEPTLNRLAEILRQNPGIRIQLGSHTDCRGNDSYNQNLSQQRAESAVNYLIGKTISADRLSARGYGETQPAISCVCSKCTEAEYQTNRRTTFKIVE